jgi:hypothetical protein
MSWIGYVLIGLGVLIALLFAGVLYALYVTKDVDNDVHKP